jgi:hypothetical protein
MDRARCSSTGVYAASVEASSKRNSTGVSPLTSSGGGVLATRLRGVSEASSKRKRTGGMSPPASPAAV